MSRARLGSLQSVARREALVWDGAFFVTIGWIVFGALPFVVILIISLVVGNYPVEGEPPPAGFPAFTPPWPGMYATVALLVVVAIVSLPLPLRGARSATRPTLLIAGGFTTVCTLLSSGLVAAREGTTFGLEWLAVVAAATTLLLLLRSIAGRLRLVPRRWREYRADDGRVVGPLDVPREGGAGARRPWAGIGTWLEGKKR